MEGGSGRPLFQLGLSLFLIIYTASILRRLPRYVRHSVFGPTRCVQKIVKSNSYHMFSINMLVQWNLCQSICCERQGQGRNQLQRWRVEAIFALSSKSSSLSLFALATSFSLSPPLFLSFFLSFIPGLSHTTTQTAASSHLLTDGRGRRRRRRRRLRGGLLRYEQLRDGPHSGFNTAYSVHTPTC